MDTRFRMEDTEAALGPSTESTRGRAARLMEKFEILEEKIRKAADLIRSLREERGQLRKEVEELSKATRDPEIDGKLEKYDQEREILAQRIERMITIIDEAGAS